MKNGVRIGQKRMSRKAFIGMIVGFVLLALFLVALGFCYRDLNAARNRIASIPSEVYSSTYGEIEYHLIGDGPVVLISHGVTGGIDQGMFLANNFFGTDHRFLYVSRFGYLKSSLPEDASARLQAAAYKDLLDHLGIDRVFLFGNSAGGPSTTWFAIDYPERTNGLILHSSAGPGPNDKFPPNQLFQYNFPYWAAIKVAPNMILSFLLPDEIRSTLTEQELALIIKDVFLAGLPITERTEGVIFDNRVSTPSVNDIPLQQIAVPTLILQAEDDPREKEAGHAMAERIPENDFVGLTGGHFLLRQDERVRAEIASFIERHR
jgi:pimeloyl-ACP methyl ester carboxylesterase